MIRTLNSGIKYEIKKCWGTNPKCCFFSIEKLRRSIYERAPRIGEPQIISNIWDFIKTVENIPPSISIQYFGFRTDTCELLDKLRELRVELNARGLNVQPHINRPNLLQEKCIITQYTGLSSESKYIVEFQDNCIAISSSIVEIAKALSKIPANVRIVFESTSIDYDTRHLLIYIYDLLTNLNEFNTASSLIENILKT